METKYYTIISSDILFTEGPYYKHDKYIPFAPGAQPYSSNILTLRDPNGTRHSSRRAGRHRNSNARTADTERSDAKLILSQSSAIQYNLIMTITVIIIMNSNSNNVHNIDTIILTVGLRTSNTNRLIMTNQHFNLNRHMLTILRSPRSGLATYEDNSDHHDVYLADLDCAMCDIHNHAANVSLRRTRDNTILEYGYRLDADGSDDIVVVFIADMLVSNRTVDRSTGLTKFKLANTATTQIIKMLGYYKINIAGATRGDLLIRHNHMNSNGLLTNVNLLLNLRILRNSDGHVIKSHEDNSNMIDIRNR